MTTFAGTSAVAAATTGRSATAAEETRETGSTLYPTSLRAPRLGAGEELSLALRLAHQRREAWCRVVEEPRWRRLVFDTAATALDEDKRPALLRDRPEQTQADVGLPALRVLATELAVADRDGVAARATLEMLETSDADGGYVARCRDAFEAAHRTRDAFVEANLGLVIVIARRYERGHLSFDDLVQEGNTGLLKAVDRFDPERGFRFSTYAVWWIRHAIGRALSDKSREIRLPVHVAERQQTLLSTKKRFESRHGRVPTTTELAILLKWPEDKVEDLLSVEYTRAVGHDRERQRAGPLDVDQLAADPELPDLDAEVFERYLRRGLRALPDIQRDILERRFGLTGSGPMTLREVGLIHHLSRERIRQLQERALAAMRREFGRWGLV